MLLIVGGFVIIKFRERVANMIGEAAWMRYVGGVYMFVVLVGIIAFLFGLARLTGTTQILLAPITYIIPGTGAPPPPSTF